MTATRNRIPEELATAGRRFGYGVAIALNLVLVWFVGNLMGWDLVGFLTPEFADLVPLIQLGLWVTIAANVVYMMDDRSLSTRAARLVVDIVNLFVTFRIFDVFPFDFSAHTFNWGLVVRAVLVIALVGTAISAVTHLARLRLGPAQDGVARGA
jgi:hypothetical protein